MIFGAVLAGGQSRRFGSDKAEAIWNDRALIDYAVAGWRRRRDGDRLRRDRLDGASIADRPQAGLGRLRGQNAALHHAEASEMPAC